MHMEELSKGVNKENICLGTPAQIQNIGIWRPGGNIKRLQQGIR